AILLWNRAGSRRLSRILSRNTTLTATPTTATGRTTSKPTQPSIFTSEASGRSNPSRSSGFGRVGLPSERSRY
ncbi:MAG: hypothetical protein ACK559_11465, partial [bacterium]